MNSAIIRSALFVPATRPERIPKALATGADAVIVDLEDAVAQDLKSEARTHLDDFLATHPGARVLVRINAPCHEQQAADIALCARHAGVTGVLLPKVEHPSQVAIVATCGKPVCWTWGSTWGWPTVAQRPNVCSIRRAMRCCCSHDWPGWRRLWTVFFPISRICRGLPKPRQTPVTWVLAACCVFTRARLLWCTKR